MKKTILIIIAVLLTIFALISVYAEYVNGPALKKDVIETISSLKKRIDSGSGNIEQDKLNLNDLEKKLKYIEISSIFCKCYLVLYFIIMITSMLIIAARGSKDEDIIERN
jgi:hypothetical protein